MILVDTPIWIDHLRQRDERLTRLLNQGQVLSHPFVIGELALGNLQNRAAILGEIAAGARSAPNRPEVILEIADRRTAIGAALARARPGDTVLLAGKGHETTILYADRAEPWNERAEAESALAALGWGA